MSLQKYHAKRNFKETPEPKGKVGAKKKPRLLYIIQKHAASHLHYDFRLELDGVLLSWAVPKGPCLDPKVKRLAMHVEDHPLEYGKFEGIIPKGQYGGGTVMLWDQGNWDADDANPAAAYKKGNLKFTLHGEKLQGKWDLVRINKNDKTWLLIKRQDDAVKAFPKYDITLKEPLSVKTGLDIDGIAAGYKKVWGKHGEEPAPKKKKIAPVAKNKKTPGTKKKSAARPPKIKLDLKPAPWPGEFKPELATLVNKPPLGDAWLHEIKFDGYRFVCLKKKNQVKLISRNGNDWTSKFPSVVAELQELPVENIILDGEIVVLDKNQRTDFQLLQNAIKNSAGSEFIYYLFDIMYYDQYSLTALPLVERKNILHQLIPSDGPVLRYSDHIIGSGAQLLAKSCELHLEGIISKQADSTYQQKRTTDWLKSKCIKRQEFIICGYTQPQNKRKYFGSLLLGTYDKQGHILYHGNVGTGFDAANLKSIHALLTKHKTTTQPFYTRPKGVSTVTWVKPVLVAEVEFTEWTQENSLRHPSFKGLRSDKSARVITREVEKPVPASNKKTSKKTVKKIQSVKLPYKLTHPDKILYAEGKITKQDVAEYYETVQNWILPYVTNRPLTLVRCPEGYQKCFYQKHLTDTTSVDGLYGIPIQEKNKKDKYIYIKDCTGLLALPQLGVLELHPWGSRINKVEKPDFIIFDLDPAPDLPWKKIVAAAQEIKSHLDEFKLKSFVKTTGGKGLHVVVPIKPEHEWDIVKNFTHVFVDFMVTNNPELYVSKMTKVLRKNKIYLDYLRNQRGATAVAPYSTRARKHAPVSVPLAWDELTNKLEDTFYTIKTLPQRLDELKNDPWQDFFKIKQSLNIKKYLK
jgi:bifunctional non-homologous end joining protein LigD